MRATTSTLLFGALALSVLSLAGCAASTSTSASTTTSPTTSTTDPYTSYSQTYTIPFATTPTFSNLTTTLKVSAKVNGGTIGSYTVDTGSVGVIVPASEVPNLPSNAPAGSLTYSSSGLKLTGVWATLPITFTSSAYADGTSTATHQAVATIPVLAVTSGTCTGSGVNSGSCTGAIPHMLGVGFGRGTTVQTAPTYNPFLNTQEMVAGTMRRGYTITHSGITLGLTTAVAAGYGTQTLTTAGTPADGTHNDWQTPSGGFKLGSGTELTGTVLMDTGLLDMIIEDTSLPSSGAVATGTAMTIYIGTHDYVFSANDLGSATPTVVDYATASHGTFVNTGLRALYHYNLLYDADGGLFGLTYIQ